MDKRVQELEHVTAAGTAFHPPVPDRRVLLCLFLQPLPLLLAPPFSL